MRQIPEFFDDLHFTETRLGTPKISGRTVCIPVQSLMPMAGHPLATDGVRFIRGLLIFRGVSTSKRALTEYIGSTENPEGFKDEYLLEDLQPIPDEIGTCRTYSFEGLLENPVAWVDWDITAKSFELHCYDCSPH